MDTSRLTSLFGRRPAGANAQTFTRRDTVKTAGLGLGMAALGATALSRTVSGQEATPAPGMATPVAEQSEAERSYTMFVQTAQSGTWAAKPGEEGVYTLTLTGLPAQTVYFSDRPSRVVGQMETDQFLSALGFIPSNPPNAALVTTADDGDTDVLVIELFNPVYTEDADDSGATLVYDVRVLENYHESRLADVAREQDPSAIPASFPGASLFIDDCADGSAYCKNLQGETMGSSFSFGCCFRFPELCIPCQSLSSLCVSIPGCEDGTCGVNIQTDCFL